jgi:hypothetical protein
VAPNHTAPTVAAPISTQPSWPPRVPLTAAVHSSAAVASQVSSTWPAEMGRPAA